MNNIDPETIASFGDEWSRFDRSGMKDAEASKTFDEYFAVLPWPALPYETEGFDMVSGSGRWGRLVAPRVKRLNCIDPSAAIDVARTKLASFANVDFHKASLDSTGLPLASQISAIRWLFYTLFQTLQQLFITGIRYGRCG